LTRQCQVAPAAASAHTPPLRSRHSLRIPEAAEYISGTNWLVEELIRNGEIPFREIGKYRTLDADDLDAWIMRQPKRRIVQNKIVVAA
jgi:excisionase family DNA binding protein